MDATELRQRLNLVKSDAMDAVGGETSADSGQFYVHGGDVESTTAVVEDISDNMGPSKSPDVPLVVNTDENNVENDEQRKNEDSMTSPVQQSSSFVAFILAELTRGYNLANAMDRFTEKRKKVYTFIHVPLELEKFMFYGFLQCIDAFLYVFTFLPLRFIFALAHLLCIPCRGSNGLSAAEKCDFIKVIILTVCSVVFSFVDTSMVYHLVRGQAIIKLYIFFNMLDVADKLFTSFGQDILDALFWTASESKKRKRDHFGVVVHLGLAIFYVMCHTFLVLCQATTLNVAFNSHNKALLTIMLSNQFVELKGSVFKKVARNNLFQISCSDVRERFHYCVLLFIVVIRNMREYSWKPEHLLEMLPDLILVFLGELMVDWLKHCFVTKFNEIPHEVYRDFTITIAYDVANSRRATAFSDHSDQVARRMGFIPLPITVVLIRIVAQSVNLTSKPAIVLLLLGFLALMLFKLANSIVLLGRAVQYIKGYEEAQKKIEALSKLQRKKAASAPTSPKLRLIEFTDVMTLYHAPPKGYTFADILQHQDELAALETASASQKSSNLTSPGSNMPKNPDGLDGGGAVEKVPLNLAAELRMQRSKSVASIDQLEKEKLIAKHEALPPLPEVLTARSISVTSDADANDASLVVDCDPDMTQLDPYGSQLEGDPLFDDLKSSA